MEPRWSQKGATLSDKSARKEYGLTQQEMIDAINAGRLQFREGSVHGNPWLRLLRHEVEALIESRDGKSKLQAKKLEKEFKELDSKARKIKQRLKAIERRQSALRAELGLS